jgi:hypothetical protein
VPEPIAHLRRQAATLTDAADIATELGDAKTALALQQHAATLTRQADDLARPHQWTGSQHGDTAGP